MTDEPRLDLPPGRWWREAANWLSVRGYEGAASALTRSARAARVAPTPDRAPVTDPNLVRACQSDGGPGNPTADALVVEIVKRDLDI